MKTAFLFPGQGAQHVGMGKDLCEDYPAARRVFDLAEEASGLPLKELCFEGPPERLDRTDVCQPAIFAVSAATLAVMGEAPPDRDMDRIRPDFAAGLSLGEYTALYAADAIDLQSAVKLVTRRGRLMQEAATARPSGMVSILGLDEAGARRLAAAASDGQILVCANFNCPGQVVLSGQKEACERAAAMAKDFGASGAVPLKVAGAFHSEVMAPAAEKLAAAMADVQFCEPQPPVVSNVTAATHASNDQIKAGLVAQLTSPVRWQQSMEYLLAQGVERFYEVGPGRVLAGLMRRINRKAEIVCLNSARAVEKLRLGR